MSVDAYHIEDTDGNWMGKQHGASAFLEGLFSVMFVIDIMMDCAVFVQFLFSFGLVRGMRGQ